MTNKWPKFSLEELEKQEFIELGRGNVISRKDILVNPGEYPIYSSAKDNEGKFGEYGSFMFDEEMITWSIDGGGKLFFRPKHKFSVTNVGGTLRVKNKDLIDTRFLFFALSDLHSRHRFDWVAKAHPSVVRKVYSKIPLPPLDEQKRIVAKLDEALGDLDQVTENSKFALDQIDALWQSLLGDVLDVQYLSLTTFKRERCGEVFNLIGGGTPSKANGDFWTGDIPWASIRDLKSRRLDRTEFSITEQGLKSSASNLIPAGNVVIATRVGLGKVVQLSQDTAINQDLRALVPKDPNRLMPDFIFYWYLINASKVVAAGTGATVQGVKLETIENLEIPMISIDQQKEVVSKLDNLKSHIDGLRMTKLEKIEDANGLRSSILSAAFAGDF